MKPTIITVEPATVDRVMASLSKPAPTSQPIVKGSK